ncbi:helix-turn-helix domain-containing protein [Clostridium beijerinckii]|uniref:helix-turn-helix domain-containing protein n=1 Tax=Clostridium beijerinckii TaxID=1520 RepID=UPI0022264980|nr:helix-turn-helix transcriptional regulator [Clostridium beijerinckii]UYZ34985.1 helix-turn-helix domain-containing protein [Clostridium beijerinckii]
MSLSDNLKRIRINRKLTQKELAEKSGITRESIGNYERGDRTPPADILKKIADALGVSIDTLTSNESFEHEILNRAIQTAKKCFNLDNDSIDDIFIFFFRYANIDTLKDFYKNNIPTLPIDDIKGLLLFISDNSLIEFNRLYENLIQIDIYNLDTELEDYCQKIYIKINNPLDYINSDNKAFLESQGLMKDGYLSLDAIQLDKENGNIKSVRKGNSTILLPKSFDEIKAKVDKMFPLLEPEIKFLSDPRLEMAYNYSYKNLVSYGYENLLIMAVEKAIKTTLSEIKEHEEKGDLFDRLSSWISKESPLYEILKKSQEKDK